VIKLVGPESPVALGSLAKEQQQPEDHDIEDKADEENPLTSDTKNEGCTNMQMRWSVSGSKLRSPPAGFGLCSNTWASPPPSGTRSRKSHV
jgi:hypothetical protein